MLSLRHEPMDDFFQVHNATDYASTESQSFISLPHLRNYTGEAKPTRTDSIITEEMCIRGIDMQGIDWFKETSTRDQYRSQSCKSGDDDFTIENKIKAQETKQVTPNEEYYTFKSSKLNEPCSIGHFQLRNLLWAANKNNIYYVWGDTVRQWSPQRRQSSQVIDLATANRPGSVSLKITSMACAHGVLFAGGFKGECVWKVVQDHCTINTTNESRSMGITNYTDIVKDRKGATLGIVSNNDASIKCINLETAQIEQKLTLPFAANCSSLSPDGRMLCLVGDSTDTLVVDADSGQSILSINEHHDYSFACCWHPDGRTFATGNQDKTTRIYDIRNTSKSVHVLGSNIGAIRSLHYSHDGHYLAAAEPIDFVHIYETEHYESSQVIDMFGDIAGVSFTPEDQSLYIANANEQLG
ncbi:hypothetical protein INT47_013180 [Mucor saturninus]|uniref:Uncharacterized protein n=1 Tax=Mucor saturninus TaxID=64648 RepID=A0A8H7QJA8_9FUNG|nr:hypothetical protein INT47_013180 [Mucor saturninus]